LVHDHGPVAERIVERRRGLDAGADHRPAEHCLSVVVPRRQKKVLHRAGNRLADADADLVPDPELHQ
jgi:hypothetical protein